MKHLIQQLSSRAGKAISRMAITFLIVTLGAGAAQAQLNAYSTSASSIFIGVIDVETNLLVDFILLPAPPRLLTINTAGSRAYVAMANNTIAVVDLVTKAVIATVPTGPTPAFLTLSGDEAFLYVNNNSSNTVTVIDTATNTVATTLTVGLNPLGIATTVDAPRSGRRAILAPSR